VLFQVEEERKMKYMENVEEEAKESNKAKGLIMKKN
jgi:hypothetical protein